jgi:hypothetical protein
MDPRPRLGNDDLDSAGPYEEPMIGSAQIIDFLDVIRYHFEYLDPDFGQDGVTLSEPVESIDELSELGFYELVMLLKLKKIRDDSGFRPIGADDEVPVVPDCDGA